jgi:AraC family transcriptional regulator
VALNCGFANQSHFTRVFTRLTGVSPGQWRRMNR